MSAPPAAVRRPRAAPVRGGARAQVYDAVRRSIVSLELPPGRALSENELAGRLGVSRTPVREALIRLADEGLVDVVPQLGTFVARINVREVLEHQFIRELLETGSLPMAIANLTAPGERTLRRVLADQQQAAADQDVPAWFESDQALHRTLLEIAGHPRAWTIVSSARAHLDRVRLLSLPDPALLASLHAEHSTIVDLVAAKEVAAAVDALRAHLRLVLDALDPLRARYPDYFDEEPDESTGAAP
jgi:DNA-binding GntR family transcriptional regulator